ncbi:MAG TPA: RNA polymerase-binding protein DksA, partial [Gammaproteobacteria bacterium]|nr:RNA polymerase-binding protein DksA [Gammaproteobacteria bacterium]
MSAKKAAAKKKATASKKKLAKKAPVRSSKAKLKSAHKPSAKTGKSAKPTSNKKTPLKLAVPKAQPKPSGKKTIATAPKKPGSGPLTPVRVASKPAPLPPPKRRSSGSVLSGPVKGFTPYQPKRGEEYMNKDQLEHFRQLLLAWKRELMEEVDRTMLHMKDDAANFPDPNDRATQESDFGLELRTRDRER